MTTTLRTDIERALDELISNEEGMKFQGLAVVLAKRRWPYLIASERHNDRGLDAYAPASLAPDGIGRGLACSVTATLGKVQGDAQKTCTHFEDVKVLMFATPQKVSNAEAKKWSETISVEYDLELEVISREDVITELLLPQHAGICRSHLGIPLPVEAPMEELVAKAQAAAAEVRASWLSHPRLAGRPTLHLDADRIDAEGRDSGEVLRFEAVRAMVRESRRLVLEGPVGRGKTTTLVQLAESYGSDALAFVVDLPLWVASGVSVLEFVSRSQPFASRGLQAIDLARLCGAVPCGVFLDGWNEIPERQAEEARGLLADLDRNFPATGIVVATRAHYLQPPLRGCTRARLRALSRAQRADYLQQVLDRNAARLTEALERDHVLDDLTRNPLILSAVISIFVSGEAIPKTRFGILEAVLRGIERAEEHENQLQLPPLRGHARDFLTGLAVALTAAGDATIAESRARAVVRNVSVTLHDEGRIAEHPEPALVLASLTAHHVLERIDYPAAAFRFEHQQFQEFLSATHLLRELMELVQREDEVLTVRYLKTYVNVPAWNEALRLVAEEAGAATLTDDTGEVAVAAGVRLVTLALTVDPVFAADLSQQLGPRVWREIGGSVGACLRRWYDSPNEHQQRCALAAMIATGSADFADILIPRLTSRDREVRLVTYRAWGRFRVSSLGEDWPNVVRAWEPANRRSFVLEALGGLEDVAIAEEIASDDPDWTVRVAGAMALERVGATSALARFLMGLDDESFDRVLRDRVLERIPHEVKLRARASYRRIIAETEDPVQRVDFRARATRSGADDDVQGLRDDLADWPSDFDHHRDELLGRALGTVAASDPAWVSAWVGRRIASGSLIPERWARFLTVIPDAFKEQLYAKLSGQELQAPEAHAVTAVVSAIADVDLIRRAFSAATRARGEQYPAGSADDAKRWSTVRQLEDVVRAIPPTTAVGGILAAKGDPLNAAECESISEIFGRMDDGESGLRAKLPEQERKDLRVVLHECVIVALQMDDFGGALKAHVAVALAKVGEAEDLTDLTRLVEADIARVTSGQEARIKGERSPAANGAAMRWAHWHTWAISQLGPQGAETLLLRLLTDQYYEYDAAWALARLACPNFAVRGAGNRSQGGAVANALGFDAIRARRYAAAIKVRIAVAEEARSSGRTLAVTAWGLKRLTTALAVVGGDESTDLILRILALPGERDGDTRLDAIETLILSGKRISSASALAVINPIIDESLSRPLHDQTGRWSLQRCLRLLPFVDPCADGIMRVREVIGGSHLGAHELLGIVSSLGRSGCPSALDLLLSIAETSGTSLRRNTADWVDAVASLDSAAAQKALFALIDPGQPTPALPIVLDHHAAERLAAHIGEIAHGMATYRARLYELCSIALPPAMRSVVASAVARLETEEALLAGLSLIHDHANPRVPHGLLHGLEGAFLARRQDSLPENWYSIEPRSGDSIRRRLFNMVWTDQNRTESARALLALIESWRVEYGRPPDEPRHPAIETGRSWPIVDSVAGYDRAGEPGV